MSMMSTASASSGFPLTDSQWPENPAHDTKVRRLVEEFDQSKRRQISLEDFVSGFRKLNITLSSEMITDLFERADVNKDKVVSHTEMQRFGELYPTLIDCMYYRAKDYWADQLQKETIEQGRICLEELKTQAIELEAERDLLLEKGDQAHQRLAAEQAIEEEAREAERDQKHILQIAEQDLERSKQLMSEALHQCHRSKERERVEHEHVLEAQRAVELAQRKLSGVEQDVAAAERRLYEIQRLLEDQQRVVDGERAVADEHRAEVEQLMEVAEIAEEAEAAAREEMRSAADSAVEAEAQVQNSQEAENNARTLLKDKQASLSRCAQARETARRALETLQIQIEAKKEENALHTQAIRQQDANIERLMQDNQALQARRAQIDEEEAALLEQEVRLREAREILENREMQLRSDFHSFSVRPQARPQSPVPIMGNSSNITSRYSNTQFRSIAGRRAQSPAPTTPHNISRQH